MQRKNTKENCRSGVTLTLNVGQATPDRKKLLIQRQVSPDLQTTVLFPSPLAGEGGHRPGEGYIKENNFMTHPSSVCWNFVPQTTSPARGEVKRLGFTLIELLVVVLIIGILAAVAVPQYQAAVHKSKAVQVITATKTLADAQKRYYLANGFYTTNINDLDVDFPLVTGQETGPSFTLTKGSGCYFNAGSLYCSLNSPIITFFRRYETDSLHCCSYATDNYKGDTLCQQLMNNKTWHNECSDSSPCHCYESKP